MNKILVPKFGELASIRQIHQIYVTPILPAIRHVFLLYCDSSNYTSEKTTFIRVKLKRKVEEESKTINELLIFF